MVGIRNYKVVYIIRTSVKTIGMYRIYITNISDIGSHRYDKYNRLSFVLKFDNKNRDYGLYIADISIFDIGLIYRQMFKKIGHVALSMQPTFAV